MDALIIKQSALREALAEREYPPLPGNLNHLLGFPYFVHISKADEALWAYTPTLNHLIQDRQVRTTPGKALRAITKLKDHQIRDLVQEYQQWILKRNPVNTLCWATTPEEAVAVYENRAMTNMVNGYGYDVAEGKVMEDTVAEGSSCGSCMGHPGHVYYNEHPARVYGMSPDGSIAIAYIKDGNGILARTVCSVKAKTYVRVYQRYHSDGAMILRGHLDGLGFEEAQYLEGKVEAVHLGYRKLVMPYLDWQTCFDWEEGQKYAYFSRDGQYTCENTNGTCVCSPDDDYDEDEESCECECCGGHYDEDDMTYVDNEGLICQDCLESHYTYAYTGRHQEWVGNSDCEECTDTGHWYTDDGVEFHSLVHDASGNLRHRDYVAWVESEDEYHDNDDVVMDGEGEAHLIENVSLDWWLLDGEMYKDDPEDSDAIRLGVWAYTTLWTVPPHMWGQKLDDLGFNVNITHNLLSDIRPGFYRWRDPASNHFYLSIWLQSASEYGVTYDDRDIPMVDGEYLNGGLGPQLGLPLATPSPDDLDYVLGMAEAMVRGLDLVENYAIAA